MATNYVSKVDGGSFIDKASWYNVETGLRAVQNVYSSTTDTTGSMVYNADAQDKTTTNLKNAVGLLMYCVQKTVTGTVTVSLSQDSGVTDTKTLVVNATDLPTKPSWVFFKFASVLALDAGTDNAVGVKASSAGNATFYTNGTAGNWASLIVWDDSPASAPVATDNFYISGIVASTSCNIVMDQTVNTAYGTFDIGHLGSLSFKSTAAANPYLRVAGMFNVWGGGTLNIGTVATPIPRDSIAILEFGNTSNGQYLLNVNAGGTLIAQGLSRTTGKNVSQCLLNGNATANAISLNVDTDTGWLNNDVIAIASTDSNSTSRCEIGAMNGDAAAGALAVDGFTGTAGGIKWAKLGTSPGQCEIINLTRNVIIRSVSASYGQRINLYAGSTTDIDWVQFMYFGWASNAGIYPTGAITATLDYCSFLTCIIPTGTNSADGITYTQCVFYDFSSYAFYKNGGAVNITYAYCTFLGILGGSTCYGCLSNGITGTNWTHCNFSGCLTGIQSGSSAPTLGTFTYNNFHGNTGSGLSMNYPWTNDGGTIDHCNFWRNNGGNGSSSGGMDLGSYILGVYGGSVTISNCKFWGNLQAGAQIGDTFRVIWDTCTFAGDTTTAQPYAIRMISTNKQKWDFDFIDCTFSPTTGIWVPCATAEFLINGGTETDYSYGFINIRLSNCTVGAPLMVSAANLGTFIDRWPWYSDAIKSAKHNGVAGSYKTWVKSGIISTDVTAGMTRTAPPSERITPNSATVKVPSGIKQVAVASGATVTPSVYVRESVVGDGQDYNGNRPRLILLANPALGINSNTVIDTATVSAEGAFEQLTGTTAAAADDGVFEFYVDCDGTTGWINIDDWTVT